MHKSILIFAVAVAEEYCTYTYSMQAATTPKQIAEFEEYLLENLKDRDFFVVTNTIGKNTWLFNVNQVAYLVEGSTAKDQQRATRQRIKEPLSSIKAVYKKCPRSGRGEQMCMSYMNFSCVVDFLIKGR